MKVVVDSSSGFDVLCWAAQRVGCKGEPSLSCAPAGKQNWCTPSVGSGPARVSEEKWGTKAWETPSEKTPNKQKACFGYPCECFSWVVLKTGESIQRNGNKRRKVLGVIIRLQGILSSCIQTLSLVSLILVNFLMVLKPNHVYLIPNSNVLHDCNTFEIFSLPIPVSTIYAKMPLIFYWNPKCYIWRVFP